MVENRLRTMPSKVDQMNSSNTKSMSANPNLPSCSFLLSTLTCCTLKPCEATVSWRRCLSTCTVGLVSQSFPVSLALWISIYVWMMCKPFRNTLQLSWKLSRIYLLLLFFFSISSSSLLFSLLLIKSLKSWVFSLQLFIWTYHVWLPKVKVSLAIKI